MLWVCTQAAGHGVRRGVADRKAVFDHRLARAAMGASAILCPCGISSRAVTDSAVRIQRLARVRWVQRYRHVVPFCDTNQCLSSCLSPSTGRKRYAASAPFLRMLGQIPAGAASSQARRILVRSWSHICSLVMHGMDQRRRRRRPCARPVEFQGPAVVGDRCTRCPWRGLQTRPLSVSSCTSLRVEGDVGREGSWSGRWAACPSFPTYSQEADGMLRALPLGGGVEGDAHQLMVDERVVETVLHSGGELLADRP